MKINRRDFIKTGGMVMLGSLAAPSFLGSCTGNGADQATGISFAQNHFGVSESDMKKVLTAALEKGGDYADLFFEHSYRNNVGLQDGAVNRASSNIDFGMGVRVLAGDQTGYAYDPEQLLRCTNSLGRARRKRKDPVSSETERPDFCA